MYLVAAAFFLIGTVLSAFTPNIYCMLVSFGVIIGKIAIVYSSEDLLAKARTDVVSLRHYYEFLILRVSGNCHPTVSLWYTDRETQTDILIVVHRKYNNKK